MSTFKGVVEEFPEIRIDYFRRSTEPGENPPLACFLSHIHSDHLQGLEGSYNAPFIYCSPATKELLVKLQRKVHRLNLQKGIVETENCQYKDKKKLLKSIPLETPTLVEVGPRKKVRVTLFDANHCVGAVMFLFEGDGKAVLYTGDMRAEDWLIEYLTRHPLLLPYTSGVKRLDKIYLDTAWGHRGCSKKFPTKREGISGLLKQLVKYPEDTVFHLNTWTFGYEEVWVALASFFRCRIHLSRYHYSLFTSISDSDKWVNGPYLGGFNLGNASQPPIITTNPDARIHSCERGMDCAGLENKKVVYITPVIALISGVLHQEDGIDYGDLSNNEDFSISGQLQILLNTLGDGLMPEAREMLLAASKSRKGAVPVPIGEFADRAFDKQELLDMLQDAAKKKQEQRKDLIDVTELYQNWPGTESIKSDSGELLPTWIRFPYSRHSSLGELRNFVAAFRPKDVYQNTVDEDSWTEANSVESLYGDLCCGKEFSHDVAMRKIFHSRMDKQRAQDIQFQEMELESQRRNLMPSQYRSSEPDDESQQLERLEAVTRAEQRREEAEHQAWVGKRIPPREQPSSPHSPQRFRSKITPPPLLPSDRPGKPNGVGGMAELLSSSPLPPVLFPVQDAYMPPAPASFRHRLPGTSTGTTTVSSSPEMPISRPGKRVSQVPSNAAGKRRRFSLVVKEPKPPLEDWTSEPNEPDTDMVIKMDAPKMNKVISSLQGGGGREIEDPDSPAFARRLAEEAAEEAFLEQDRVEEAVCAALEIGGENWWDIELESTKKKWRYEKEVEL